MTVVWVGYDTPRSLGEKQDGAHVAGPIWHDFMQAALRDRPVLDFRVPDGLTLARWGCGRHECVDAFRPDQVPGSGGVGGDRSTGDDTASADNSVQMVPADSENPPAVSHQSSGPSVDSGVGGLY